MHADRRRSVQLVAFLGVQSYYAHIHDDAHAKRKAFRQRRVRTNQIYARISRPSPRRPVQPPQRLFPSPQPSRKAQDTAERRQVTVMFSDLVGSTALSGRMDPEDLREVISAYQKCVTATVRRFGGFVAKYMGDGVLIYFGYPQAHEDDAERAVRGALELVAAVSGLRTHAPLQTRVGIATGLDDRFHETDHGTGNLLADSSFVVDRTRSGIMAGWRLAVALAMTGEEIEALTALSRSRTEPAGRVSRAAMLLGYREKPSFFAVGRRLGVHHQTVQRCVERAMAYGVLAALDDRPRPGKEPTITPEAKAWLVSLACDKAKEHGYPHELWTTRLLARHARERGPAAGHQCLARLAQGTVCKLLGQEEIKPHKVRYYLERRDAEFEPKMAEVLCVYREVQVLKKAAAKAEKSKNPVAIVSYDEKPGIQAIATTAPDLPPVPGRHASFARDHEYKRHGTLSLLAGIDLLTGKVHALVRERHRSREFIEFLKLLDAAYPASTAIKLILDNHSAHISRETRAWLDTRPPGRFDFTFTPKHGSWLNLIEGFFSKFARAVLRHIRVTSKQELKERIMAGIDDVNRHPVIHTWSYNLAEAA